MATAQNMGGKLFKRQLQIAVFGATGAPFEGAIATLMLDGRFAGKVASGSRPITVYFSSPWNSLAVRVAAGGHLLVESIKPDQDLVEFHFPVAQRFAVRGAPVAECPDGTTGSPCVTCRSGRKTWRICG